MIVKSLKSHLITCWEKFYVSDLGLSTIYQWKNRKEHLHILTTEKTIKYILKHNCSVARFGEGEFELMLYSDLDLGFQKRDPELANRLKYVLASNDPNLLICIPYALNNINGRTKHSKMFWLNWGRTNDQHSRIVLLIRKLHPEGYCFGDTQITRPYIAYKTPKHGARVFPMLKELWNEQDVLIVEGEKTRLGVGNDLFDNAKSVKRVLCPATNAFDRYDEIIKAVTEVWNGELILLALGPTATVLAADFASRGIRAIDLGHLDIEYEWFLSGAKGHDQIKGKFTNEASGGNVVAECDDIEYQRQIIYRVV